MATGSYLEEEATREIESASLRSDAGDPVGAVDTDASVGDVAPVTPAMVRPAPVEARTTAELMETVTGSTVDAPLCFTCGTKMRPSGSCYVCEGCGSTSGCS